MSCLVLRRVTPFSPPSNLSRQVIEDHGSQVKIKCANAGKDFSPEEISAQVRPRFLGAAGRVLASRTCRHQLEVSSAIALHMSSSMCSSSSSTHVQKRA